MDIKEAMAFISGTQKFGQNLGLARMEWMLKKLGDPHKDIRAIHIAGTNGKGSVAAVIAEALMKHGLRVGLYTSPYIEEFNERIQINRQNIEDEDLARHIGTVKQVVEEGLAQGMEQPTEFEIITTIMFLYYKEQQPDYCVIEVGLGGDLDSTNVVMPILSVITSISYDHMNVLGSTLTEIARAKAGIIKPGVPVISYPQEPEAAAVLQEKAREMGSDLMVIDPSLARFQSFDQEKGTQTVCYQTPSWQLCAELRLLGVHQLTNSLLALTALDRMSQLEGLGISAQTAADCLRSVRWMGRLEIMHKDPLVLIDGAHNVDGITKLKNSLDFYYKGINYVLILGILADKDTHAMADLIARDASSVICVTPHSDRASLARDLYEYIHTINEHVSFEEDYREALRQALAQCKDHEFIIASGSLYMVGDMRRIMREEFGIPYEQ